jgi:hypothetical protein
MNGQEVDSLSGETWKIFVNDEGQPCFQTVVEFGLPAQLSCVTTCDILCQNGIIHQVSSILVHESLATRGPSPPLPPTFRSPVQPTGNANSRFKATPAPAGAPSPPVSFERPDRLYDDDVLDDQYVKASQTSAGNLVATAVGAILLPVLLALFY